MGGRIYFDNAATTPLDPRVADAMHESQMQCWGNPSSLHGEGREAKQAVETARRRVADLISAEPEEIIFTGSGTEADNMALHGLLGDGKHRPSHAILSAIEHPAMLECAKALAGQGVEVSLLPVDEQGIVDPTALARALRPETRLVSVMAANNILGTIQPLAELAAIVRRHGALFHVDAVQAAGKIPLDVKALDVDLLSLSAHKIHGPKGVGALFVRKGVQLTPLIAGGGQERNLRSGTENVAGIVGFGVAAEIARREMSAEAARLVRIRDYLIDAIMESIDNAYLVGDRWRRLPGHICLGFEGMEGEAIKLLLELDAAGAAVSTGSACGNNHAAGPSHVLMALGFNPIKARGSLRITLGRFNTQAEAERFVDILPPIVARLRPMHGLVAAMS